jgi:PIN domain nuclease of toxin-antitoxin system
LSDCLDAWAVLAWLDGEEPALSRVNAALPDRPIVSWINLVEVYYRVERDHGRAEADATLADVRAVVAADMPGSGRMIEAARLKARMALALGDCFALATAAAHGVRLLTGDPGILDHPDLPCEVEDLRAGDDR